MTYNLIRLKIGKAALAVKCEPIKISFICAFHVIQYHLHWLAITQSYGKIPALLKRLRGRLVTFLHEERPGRSYDRAVKALPQGYTVCAPKKNLN